MLALLCALLATTSHAGTVTLQKKGLMPAHVWVDGKLQTELKRGELVVEIGDGPHEVAITQDETGFFLRCATELSPGASLEVKDAGCTDLPQSKRTADTVIRGAIIRLSGPDVNGQWVTLDDVKRPYVMTPFGTWLNVQPGVHTLILAEDGMGNGVRCQGQLSAPAGGSASLTVTTAGCVGFAVPVLMP